MIDWSEHDMRVSRTELKKPMSAYRSCLCLWQLYQKTNEEVAGNGILFG